MSGPSNPPGHRGWSLALSICFRKVKLPPALSQCHQLLYERQCHVWPCLCGNASKRSLVKTDLNIFHITNFELLFNNQAKMSSHSEICALDLNALFSVSIVSTLGGGEKAQSLASLSSGWYGFAPSSIRLLQKGGILWLCYWLVPTSAEGWFKKGSPYVIMSV